MKLMVMLIAMMTSLTGFADVEVGSYIRSKKVAFISVDVYQFTVSSAQPLSDRSTVESILNQLSSSSKVILDLKFLRDVDAKKVSEGFKSGLVENGVSTDSDEIQKFLAAVSEGGEAKKGQRIRMVMNQLSSGVELTFENEATSKKSTMTFPVGTHRKILMIWFGKPADSGLEKLQKQFLK